MGAAVGEFQLDLLDEAVLAQDPHPDLPFTLSIRGLFEEPVDGVEVADIQVRLNSANLADLLAQGRARQLGLVSRIRRQQDAAGQIVEDVRAVERADTGLLVRVLSALRASP